MIVCAFAACCLFASSAVADDFSIAIQVKSPKRQGKTQRTRQTPGKSDGKSRPSFKLKAGAGADLIWEAANTSADKKFKNVLVHVFIVPVDKVGQARPPKLTKNVAYESALTMDFAPKEKAQWKHTLRLNAAGVYLLRVETIGLRAKHGHDYFAAMDLIVE